MNFEKYVRLTTGFQSAKYAIGFNGLQVCPSVPLNLVAVPTVGKSRVKTQLLYKQGKTVLSKIQLVVYCQCYVLIG